MRILNVCCLVGIHTLYNTSQTISAKSCLAAEKRVVVQHNILCDVSPSQKQIRWMLGAPRSAPEWSRGADPTGTRPGRILLPAWIWGTCLPQELCTAAGGGDSHRQKAPTLRSVRHYGQTGQTGNGQAGSASFCWVLFRVLMCVGVLCREPIIKLLLFLFSIIFFSFIVSGFPSHL